MNSEEMLMEVRETQAFWKGVIRGVIGCAVFFAGLVILHRISPYPYSKLRE